MLTNLLRLLMARSIKPFIFKNNFEYGLDIDVENPGLYFHIPFCRKICSFCPYYKIKFDGSLLGKFNEALIKELHLVAEQTNRKKKLQVFILEEGLPP